MSNKKKKAVSHQYDLLRADDSGLAGLFLLLTGIVTLLVRVKVIDFTAPRIINPILDSGLQAGLFTYYKWWLVIAVAVAAIAILLHKMLVGGYSLRASYINGPLLVLVSLGLLSLLLAQYKGIALLGLYNQRDGSLVMLAYLALCLTAANTVYKSWFRTGINAALLMITLVNTVIILWHFSGHNLLQVSFIQTLVAPPQLRSSLSGNITNTLGNVNYLSGLAAALFAYFIAGTLLYSNWRERLPAMLGALAAFTMLLASLSSSGFVTLVLVSPLLLAVAWRSPDRKMTALAGGIALAACLAIFAIMNSCNPQVGTEAVGFIPQIQESGPTPEADSEVQGPVSQGEEFRLPVPGWSAGTGRIYIWRETGQLTLHRPLAGYGLGTLAYYFPQNDINKIANLNDYNTLITKPHNMYLGIAYGMGLPALLALLTLFLLHFYYTGRYLWQAKLTAPAVFPAALFMFFCAFVIQALFNDPVIDAGGMFWTLLGVGVAYTLEAERLAGPGK